MDNRLKPYLSYQDFWKIYNKIEGHYDFGEVKEKLKNYFLSNDQLTLILNINNLTEEEKLLLYKTQVFSENHMDLIIDKGGPFVWVLNYLWDKREVLDDSLFDEFFGYGKLNEKALKLLREYKLTKEQKDFLLKKRKWLSYLYKYQFLDDNQIKSVINKRLNLEKFIQYYPINSSHIDYIMEILYYLWYLYENQELTKEQIDKAMKIWKYLQELYSNQELTKEQIEKAMEIWKGLQALYSNQKLTKEQIDKAMKIWKYLQILYENQELTEEQIEKAMEIWKYLQALYENQELTKEQIEKAIEIWEWLMELYSNQKLTEEQIDKAMEIWEYLRILYEDQKLTEEQIEKAMEIWKELWELYIFQKLPKKIIDRLIKKGWRVTYGVNYSILDVRAIMYFFQELTEEQIDEAIEIWEYLWILYEFNKLTEKQIEKALEKKTDIWELIYWNNNLSIGYFVQVLDICRDNKYIMDNKLLNINLEESIKEWKEVNNIDTDTVETLLWKIKEYTELHNSLLIEDYLWQDLESLKSVNLNIISPTFDSEFDFD